MQNKIEVKNNMNMKNLTTRKIENIVTKTGVCLLVVTTIAFVLLLADNEYGKHVNERHYSSKYDDIALYLFGVFSLLIFVCATVATMLNISRIANAIEDIAESHKVCVDKEIGSQEETNTTQGE